MKVNFKDFAVSVTQAGQLKLNTNIRMRVFKYYEIIKKIPWLTGQLNYLSCFFNFMTTIPSSWARIDGGAKLRGLAEMANLNHAINERESPPLIFSAAPRATCIHRNQVQHSIDLQETLFIISHLDELRDSMP